VELHICALQLDIIERLIKRYSNEGELILDPFGGLGSTALQAIKMKRRGYSIELNPGYWKDSCRYLSLEEKKSKIPTLFDAVIPDCFSAA
jgi:DNA modification methylase